MDVADDQTTSKFGLKAIGIPSLPGTYVLVLASTRIGTIRVGRLGSIAVDRGFYAYVGSAFGPGGLAARIGHHLGISARPRWHIDYLRARCDLMEVWFTADSARREHSWAEAVGGMPGASIPL